MSVTDRPIPYAESELLAEHTADLPRWLWALAGFIAAGLVALGCVLLALPFFIPALFGSAGTISASYGLMAITLGSALLIGSVRGWRRAPARHFYSRWAWLYLILVSVAIAVLAVLLPSDVQNTPLFAPFHFALILLPGLLLLSLLALLSGRGSAVAGRRLSLAAAGGATSVTLAIPLELIGLAISGIVAVAVAMVIPGGVDEFERIIVLLEGWSLQPPTDELEILTLVASPIVLLGLAVLLGVIAPLVEEFGKTLVLGVMGIWVKPSVLVGFIWGVACGLGFAWLEGISNGALGLGDTTAWLGGVGVRVLATSMHALTGGILGVGWAYLWRGKRWALLLSYAVAVVFHGLWNLNVVMSLGGVGIAGLSPAVGGALAVLGVGFQLLLVAVCLSALVGIPLLLRRRDATRVAQPS